MSIRGGLLREFIIILTEFGDGNGCSKQTIGEEIANLRDILNGLVTGSGDCIVLLARKPIKAL